MDRKLYYVSADSATISDVIPFQAVVYTLNAGANYQNAGPLPLIGGCESYRTELPSEIKNFKQFRVRLNEAL
jgi:hypothetical protein